jgi:hypothetical protein
MVIHNALDDNIAQNHRTVAVVTTVEGVNVVASSNRNLEPEQRAVLKANEVAAPGVRGQDAEVTAIDAAIANGLTPVGVAASRGNLRRLRRICDRARDRTSKSDTLREGGCS